MGHYNAYGALRDRSGCDGTIDSLVFAARDILGMVRADSGICEGAVARPLGGLSIRMLKRRANARMEMWNALKGLRP